MIATTVMTAGTVIGLVRALAIVVTAIVTVIITVIETIVVIRPLIVIQTVIGTRIVTGTEHATMSVAHALNVVGTVVVTVTTTMTADGPPAAMIRAVATAESGPEALMRLPVIIVRREMLRMLVAMYGLENLLMVVHVTLAGHLVTRALGHGRMQLAAQAATQMGLSDLTARQIVT
jgi:hypothetical protein